MDGGAPSRTPASGSSQTPSERSTGTVFHVLLAYDGSASAERALEVVESIDWPRRTVVRVVTSPARLGLPLGGIPNAAEAALQLAHVRGVLTATQARALGKLQRKPVHIEMAAPPLPAGAAILDAALDQGANLVVTGSRSLSAFESLLVGSVSSQVIERAGCSVLVVRRSPMHRVLLVVDSAARTSAAAGFVARWALFRRSHVRVIGITRPVSRFARVALTEGEMARAYEGQLASATDEAWTVARRAAHLLNAAGLSATTEARLGSFRASVLAEARAWPADLVIIEANARDVADSELDDLARDLIHQIRASVLVVRRGLRPDPSQTAAPSLARTGGLVGLA